MATYDDQMADISTMSADELVELEKAIVASFDAADTEGDLDAMAASASHLEAVRGQRKKTLVASVHTEAEQNDEGGEGTEGVVASSDGEKENPYAEDEKDKEDEEESSDSDDETVTASAETNTDEATKEATVDIPVDRQPVATAPATVITAGADITGFPAGSQFKSALEVSEAMLTRINALRGSRGDGEQVLVASIKTDAGSDRTLDPGDLEGNRLKIAKVTETEAIVASGGYCAPLETRYDIFGLGIADRPVKAALAGFQAKRGGIRFVQPPKLGDLAAAVGVWTAANDANPTAPTEKPCLKVDCAPEQTAVLDAVTLCLEFGNLQARAFPELVTRHNELGMIQHARLADLTLLSKISALSTAVTSAFRLSFARDFLEVVGRAATAYRHRHRMGDDARLRVIAPAWVRDAIREDLTLGLPGDQLEWADSVINGFFNTRKVNISWHLDDASSLGSAQAAGALNAWPTSFKWNLFAEGTFLFLDGGTLDLGIVRDSGLVATNDYKMFVETFVGVAKLGIEAIEVTTTTSVTGQVSATADITP
jgi:hypothetical protein